MDDTSGATHLFYRKYSYQDLGSYWRRHNDVFHLDLTTGSDTLMFEDYFNNTSTSFGGVSAKDFEFWNNNPQQFILCAEGMVVDPVAFISHYQAGDVWNYLGQIFNLEISQQNDSLLYSLHSNLGQIKSTDGGYTWFADSNAALYFDLIAISPFNDRVFYSAGGGGLYKSTNSGMIYSLVDSSINWGGFDRSYLFSDSDSFYVYGVMHGYNQSYFLRSTDAGDSWDLLKTSSNQMCLSIDPSQSGMVFLSDGSEVKLSTDYGFTFNSYWQLARPVVGMYKKPNSDILYAATTKDIYVTTPIDTVSIKHLSSIIVSVDDKNGPVAKKFKLYQNYPNPFNPTTTIRFDLPKASRVKIELFSITGEKVATIFEGQKAAGSHVVKFNSSKLVSGVYFYRLAAGKFTDVKKMILMR